MSWPAVFSHSTIYVTNRVTLGELQGSLCALLLVLRCIVALLADHSGLIFAFLQISADSALCASPNPTFIFVDDFNTTVMSFKEVLLV